MSIDVIGNIKNLSGYHVNISRDKLTSEMLPFEVDPQPSRRYWTGDTIRYDGKYTETACLTFSNKSQAINILGDIYPSGNPDSNLPDGTFIPSAEYINSLCTLVDIERDKWMARDYRHNFGDIQAVDDFGVMTSAGIRYLQVSEKDISNWQTIHGLAIAAIISGQPTTIVPMRVEDNWNVLTTALQVVSTLTDMTKYYSDILFFGGRLKSQIRVSEDPRSIDIYTPWLSIVQSY